MLIIVGSNFVAINNWVIVRVNTEFADATFV